jgi:hypothetical protein
MVMSAALASWDEGCFAGAQCWLRRVLTGVVASQLPADKLFGKRGVAVLRGLDRRQPEMACCEIGCTNPGQRHQEGLTHLRALPQTV